MADLQPDQLVRVLATDAHAELDLEVFCATAGHHLLQSECAQGVWEFLLRKG